MGLNLRKKNPFGNSKGFLFIHGSLKPLDTIEVRGYPPIGLLLYSEMGILKPEKSGNLLEEIWF